ncbi:MAG: tRNA-(ms[2]io[6]A)-hydroxylase [Myxococcota bacterium]
MLRLRYETSPAWVEAVQGHMDAFLQDHAANERKVSHSAMTLAAQHPGREALVEAMIDVAREELDHFEQVFRLLQARGVPLAHDVPDPYMGRLFKAVKSSEADRYLLDRLILFGIVEARACERFLLVGKALTDEDLAAFYLDLARSEARHHALYITLARRYFDGAQVDERLDALLDLESEVLASIPIRPRLH